MTTIGASTLEDATSGPSLTGGENAFSSTNWRRICADHSTCVTVAGCDFRFSACVKVILTGAPVKDNFRGEVVVAPSVLRHGVSEDDALHAFRNAVIRWKFDEEFEMLVGADSSGRLLEVGLVRVGERLLLIHAMAARTKYLPRKD